MSTIRLKINENSKLHRQLKRRGMRVTYCSYGYGKYRLEIEDMVLYPDIITFDILLWPGLDLLHEDGTLLDDPVWPIPSLLDRIRAYYCAYGTLNGGKVCKLNDAPDRGDPIFYRNWREMLIHKILRL